MHGQSSKTPYKPTRIVILMIAIVVPMPIVLAAGLAGIRLNTTPSVPLGLYRITPDARAPFVEFCPSEPFGSLSVARGYRARRGEACPDGGVPLLKPAVAHAGDKVDFTARGILVNSIPIPNTAPRSRDSAGRPLSAWRFGRYNVAAGTVWVASSYNSRSFDSRYFGPISETAIKHWLRPVWTE